MELILATHNLHKIREFRDLFLALPHIELLSLLQFPGYIAPEETGKTFKENALLKAEHVAKSLNRLVLSDDSGLVVPALNGEPGILSARYAGLHKNDFDNNTKLLQSMSKLDGDARTAYYECCLVIADPSGVKKCVEGICEGKIAHSPRGRNGFGYDALFIKNDYEKTFAELERIKNQISHRRKAFERLRSFLESQRD
ncbi:MAG: RdgB/HAM1 family non-canonical purine NTP pyrophosphatase [Parachlamydiaceae bacterium]|nr:RdgB/HAM1 family non-canonical purine NTP pyrophosphatase [Parachlamydiaceae bacterium]